MKPYTHGGEIYDKDIQLDVSINVNPFGMPTSVQSALVEAMSSYTLYPDDTCSSLRKELSNYHSVDRDYILCGNGAADIIYRFCMAIQAKTAMVLAPTFSEYEAALAVCGTRVEQLLLTKENGFSITKERVKEIPAEIDVLFLCNPNNPVGNLIPLEVMEEIIAHCRQHEIFLFVDECFMEFTGKVDQHSVIPQCNDMTNLLVVKAFTKSYGMAGIRLGYGISSDKTLLKKMKQVGPPWNVSTPAQVAGCVALKEEEYLKETVAYVTKEREILVNGLRELGFTVYESETNYVLFEGYKELYEQLLNQKVLIRQCGNYHGLSDCFYRSAVRTNGENKALLEAIRSVREEI